MTKAEELKRAAEGKGCLGKSADDEPVFVLCARDVLDGGLRATLSKNIQGILVGRIRFGLTLRRLDVVQIVLNRHVEGNALGCLFAVIQGI